MNRAPFFSSLFFLCYFCFPPLGVKTALAEDYTSGNFIIKDPVLNAGTYGTSASFQLFGSLGELSLGTTSAATFSTLSGFLGYPLVTTPAISATAGDGQVSLSWTVSEGFLGFTVSGYQVGRSTTDGGPYTYTSVGNVTSALISSHSWHRQQRSQNFVVNVRRAIRVRSAKRNCALKGRHSLMQPCSEQRKLRNK